MMRIAVAGWQHETNSFSPHHAGDDAFYQADQWPALTEGEAVFSVLKSKNIPASGFIEAAQASGHDVLPLFWCSAPPSGPVHQKTFDALLLKLLDALALIEVDAVYLDLHGAMITEENHDADGSIIRSVRDVVGPDVLIAVSVDLHANMHARRFDDADFIQAYRTYPHTDMAKTGLSVLRFLTKLNSLSEAQAYHVHHQTLPFLIPMEAQCTLVEPALGIYAFLETLEHRYKVHLSYAQAFPMADTAHTAPCVWGYGLDAQQVRRAVDALFAYILEKQSDYSVRLFSVSEAMDALKSKKNTLEKPIILADTQDNPGCGGSGSSVAILKAVIASRLSHVALGVLCDPQAIEQLRGSEEGSLHDVCLGEEALALRVSLRCIKEGRFLCKGPFYQGCWLDLGWMACVRIEAAPGLEGVDVVLASRAVQAADRGMFAHVGVLLDEKKVWVLKSSVHFRADFQTHASEVLVVASGGLHQADLKKLPYRYCHALREAVL
jgi:microcystin degradation protein MlrC